MKKIIAIMTVWVMCMGLYAQNPETAKKNGPQGGSRREFNPELYRKTMQDFIINEAKLTEAEANQFFPLLNEMLDKQHKVMKQQRELMMKGKPEANLTEAEYENIITKTTNNDVELKKIEQTYYKKFHSALSWKKIYAVRQALNRFQMEALRHFQPGKGKGHKSNGPTANGSHK